MKNIVKFALQIKNLLIIKNKQKMKKLSLVKLLGMGALAFGMMVMTNACSDPCKDVTCLNGGTCAEGTCDCTTGYEGDDCGTQERTKFIGTYGVSDVCSLSGGSGYDCTIKTSGTDISKVLITNVWDSFSADVVATVSGTTITVANQEPDSDGYTVAGNGTISGTTISMTLTITETTTSTADICNSTWTLK